MIPCFGVIFLVRPRLQGGSREVEVLVALQLHLIKPCGDRHRLVGGDRADLLAVNEQNRSRRRGRQRESTLAGTQGTSMVMVCVIAVPALFPSTKTSVPFSEFKMMVSPTVFGPGR